MNDLKTFNLQGALANANRSLEEITRLRTDAIEEKTRQEAKDRENFYRQTEILEGLLEDSKNAIEQRNAIIRFMVEELINSKQPKEEKRKLLMDLLVPIATVSSGAGDLMQMVKDGLETIG